MRCHVWTKKSQKLFEILVGSRVGHQWHRKAVSWFVSGLVVWGAVAATTTVQQYEQGRRRVVDNLKFYKEEHEGATTRQLKQLCRKLEAEYEVVKEEGAIVDNNSLAVPVMRYLTRGHRRLGDNRGKMAGMSSDSNVMNRGHFPAALQAKLLESLYRDDIHPLRREKSLFESPDLPSARALQATLVVRFPFLSFPFSFCLFFFRN